MASVNPAKRMRQPTTLAPLMEKDKNCLSLQYCKVVASNMSWLEEHASFLPSKFAFWVNLNPTLWVATSVRGVNPSKWQLRVASGPI